MNIYGIAIGGVIIAFSIMGIYQNNKKTNEFYMMQTVICCLGLIIGLVFALWGVSQ
jgi:hypothetical protein